MKNWRPDGWVDVSNNAVTRLKKQGIDFNPACFIAGADAMLEGLKSSPDTQHCNGDDFINPAITPVRKGYLVFIPEEQ